MIFITGPLFSGTQDYAEQLHRTGRPEYGRVLLDAQDRASGCPADRLEALADRIAGQYDLVTAAELGGGIVPADREERIFREQAGRLSCLLAERADTVVRICCGLPAALKGVLPQ